MTLPATPGPELVALLRRELGRLDERIGCLTRNRDAIRDYLEPRPESAAAGARWVSGTAG
ncbi:hypothetical protein [Kitasatospora sp. NPDC098663]|uniref:hypothetical protein n=1 Tax=Kitasatospora sp. NPDC098663 TaxID=3364096 RepID=UPI0038017914